MDRQVEAFSAGASSDLTFILPTTLNITPKGTINTDIFRDPL